jgi:hypothetical protein
LAFFTPNTEKYYIDIIFMNKRQCCRRKLAKIAETIVITMTPSGVAQKHRILQGNQRSSARIPPGALYFAMQFLFTIALLAICRVCF